ncbi:MAG: diguanylate cyclase [Terracidiphilus sp.]
MIAAFPRSRLRVSGWLVFLILCGSACAQQYSFQTLGADQGLSNLGVKNLYQDKQGFLWVSTEGGVFRYDGRRFRAFGQDEGLPTSSGVAFAEAPDGDLLVGGEIGLFRLSGSHFTRVSLPGNRIVTWTGGLKTDAKGHVYVGTNDGLWELTESFPDKQFLSREVPTPPAVKGKAVRGIFAEDHAIWYGCGQQLCRLSDEKVRVYGAESGLPAGQWRAIGRDMHGNLWVRSGSVGVGELSSGSNSFKLQNPPSMDIDVGGIPAIDSDGFVLLPSSRGLVVRRGNDWWRIGREAGLKGVVYAVLQDREGSVWLGMAGRGLVRWAGYKVWEAYTADNGLASDLAYQILPRPDGTVWVGTESGLMRGTRRGDGYTWERVKQVGLIPVHSVQAAADGTLWLGTEMRGVAHLNPASGSVTWMSRAQGLDANSPFALLINHQHRIWVGTENGLYVADEPFSRFRLVEQLPRTHFWAIVETPNGDIWAGGAAGVFHLSGNTWERFTKKDGLSRDVVLSLCAAGNGEVWIGYRYGGEIDKISQTNGRSAITHVLSPGSGGAHLTYFLGFDAGDRLWAGTDDGVFVLDKGNWSHIHANDGLVWDDCDVNGFAAQPDGTVWVGTSGGLARYTPLPHPLPAYPLSVVFTGLTLGKKEVLPTDHPSVQFGANELIAQYSDLNFTYGNSLAFRYRLMPLFNEWRITGQRELEFPGLPPGSYQLEVQVRDQWGNWSAATAAFNFEILAPWYRTWWFLSLCGFSVFLLMVSVIRLREMVLRSRERELTSIVEERTIELQMANEELKRLSSTDGLTGLANRRAFDEFLSREWARLRRSRDPLSVLLLDVDHFKILNDTEGHQQGDRCLVEIGKAMRGLAKRETDLVARYGGEEFAFVLPATSAADAIKFAENVRLAVLNLQLIHPQSPVLPFLTVSIGVGTERKGGAGSVEEFLAAVDRALYSAKRNGRNRTVFFQRTAGNRVA